MWALVIKKILALVNDTYSLLYNGSKILSHPVPSFFAKHIAFNGNNYIYVPILLKNHVKMKDADKEERDRRDLKCICGSVTMLVPILQPRRAFKRRPN